MKNPNNELAEALCYLYGNWQGFYKKQGQPAEKIEAVERFITGEFWPKPESGKHIGAARNWLQWNIPGGDRMKWGSDETFTMTMAQLDKLAQVVAESCNK